MTDELSLPEVPGLAFTRFDVSQIGSISGLFTTRPRCGIYVLEFANGTMYAGQAVDVVGRFSNHRRTWKDDTIVALQFASCRPGELDRLEQLTITVLELDHDLRNKLLTGRPGGRGELLLTLTNGHVVHLPWGREDRPTLDVATPIVPTKRNRSKAKQYKELKKHPEYQSIVAVIGRYVLETIPGPVAAQGMWSLTAVPGTNVGTGFARPFTLNIGSMETLFAWQDKTTWKAQHPTFRLNIRAGNDFPGLLRRVRHSEKVDVRLRKAAYGRAFQVSALEVRGTDALAALLKYNFVLDAAYHLNVSLMREGSRMHARHHNGYFAADVLEAAKGIEHDERSSVVLAPKPSRWSRLIWLRPRNLR